MIDLTALDYILIFSFFSISIFIGFWVSKKSGKNASEFFLSGRRMPWWLLGLSMVATTFSTDTPNLVTDIVRTNGVAGNWVWWAFLLSGMLTVFIYARLWRKSGVTTDIEFYELRYGGKPAKFLRAFRAVYLGVLFNILAMAGVTLAAIKIGQVMMGLNPIEVVLIAGVITVVFSAAGGFKGVVYTDFLLFFVAFAGSIGAAYYCVSLPEVGGLSNLIQHEQVNGKLDFLPDFSDAQSLIMLLIIPLAVQWWSAWYPGSEPGGGGYIAQRMLASKSENHAIGATFFFNIMHYALRPWPWILVALASLVIYPDIASLQSAFPDVEADKLGHDLAYSAMLTKLPAGLLGLVLASLVAAYMSTISTHLNWGASYIVHDFYVQHIHPSASQKELVVAGRVATVILMAISALLALYLKNALQLFNIILMFGAGTGLIFILRWFWWRINAWSEISAMFASGIISLLISFTSFGPWLFGDTTGNASSEAIGLLPTWSTYPFIVASTSLIWLITTIFTKPESVKTLERFYIKTQPGGPGWRKIVSQISPLQLPSAPWAVPQGILAMILGCIVVYGALFATGFWLYGELVYATLVTSIVLSVAFVLIKVWKRLKSIPQRSG